MAPRSSRRVFLAGAFAIPAVAVGTRALAAVGRAAAAVRPGARGTSRTTCARCGGRGHSMLDASCPATPEVT